MASIDYYENSSKWGNYQYLTLEEVINNYAMSRDSDDFTSNTQRHKILYQAMRGLRELYFDTLQEVKAIQLELSPALSVVLPPDYINYVRISWVDEFGQLHPMANDPRMSIAQQYLQDHEYNLLFDSDGCVLKGSPDGGASSSATDSTDGVSNSYSFCRDGFAPNADMSKYFPNGKYRLDKNAGVIQFGSGIEGKSIVLEYISDGLFTGCEGSPEEEIRINKFAESTILDFIYYQLIKNRRQVPYNEKMRARKEYYNSRRITKARINTLRKSEIIQAFKGSSKWIK